MNLKDAYEDKRHHRSKRAINVLREKAKRIAKVKHVVVDESLNRLFWDRGASNPPRKLTVVIERVDDDTAELKLPEEKG
ncbi:MAG: hypothetical protein RMJ75_00710 [Nitrososphaerota archaeon]|nr:hypothetical protein [Nitrososphaerota archaeon]